MDLLVHPEGPRLRDRVSHGEVLVQHDFPCLLIYMLSLHTSLHPTFIKVDLFSLSKTLADFTLGVAIAFTSLYTIDYFQV